MDFAQIQFHVIAKDIYYKIILNWNMNSFVEIYLYKMNWQHHRLVTFSLTEMTQNQAQLF